VRRPAIKSDPIRKAVETTLAGERRTEAEVSVLIVNDALIRELNRSYRGIDSPTDVLAFPMAEGEFASVHPDLLGDVVISADRAEAQAARAGHDLMTEIRLLAVHGTLHLLGYEDETGKGRARMVRLARAYLKGRPASGGEGPSRAALP
jgi:probable rRNA maturation factor